MKENLEKSSAILPTTEAVGFLAGWNRDDDDLGLHPIINSSTGIFNVGGDVTSMVNGIGGITDLQSYKNSLEEGTIYGGYNFVGLFMYSKVVDASGLIIPNILSNNSCMYMFYHCTNLTIAPALLNTTLEYNCYVNMFTGCSNLRYIKAMLLTEPNNGDMWGWVDGVSPTGTFVKNSSATWENIFDTYAIPLGWTVEYADT